MSGSILLSEIVRTVRLFHADVQAVYLFGSYGSEAEREDSDVDLAILLPHESAKKAGNLSLKECACALIDLLHRPIDLINLRVVNTVFQNEIIQTGCLLLKVDVYETEFFEMLVLSFYQKLNEERALILLDILQTGRVLSI